MAGHGGQVVISGCGGGAGVGTGLDIGDSSLNRMATTLCRSSVLDRSFFLGGKAKDGKPACDARFTIEVEPGFVAKHGCQPHYTFQIDYIPAKGTYAEAWMVKMLAGPDNTRDYRYVGMLESGKVRLTAKSGLTRDSIAYRILARVLACYWAGEQVKIALAGWRVLHEGRCCVCGRALTRPDSIEAGIGPECSKRQ